MFSPLETELEISTRQKVPTMACRDVKIPGSDTPAASQGAASSCQCKRHRFSPWVWKIPWRRAWLLTPVFLPRKFHGQRRLVGYSPWGNKELDKAECTLSETPASRGEHEDTHLGISSLLPMKEHKQRSPLVHLHDGLSSPPSFVLGQTAFQTRGGQ